MDQITGYQVKTKDDKTYLRETSSAYGRALTLSFDRQKAFLYADKDAANLAAHEYVENHQTVYMKDLAIVKVNIIFKEARKHTSLIMF